MHEPTLDVPELRAHADSLALKRIKCTKLLGRTTPATSEGRLSHALYMLLLGAENGVLSRERQTINHGHAGIRPQTPASMADQRKNVLTAAAALWNEEWRTACLDHRQTFVDGCLKRVETLFAPQLGEARPA